jgi:acetate kinase
MMSAGESAGAGAAGLVLVLNSGSSSVKFALVDPGTGERPLGGLAEAIGTAETVLRIRKGQDGAAVTGPLPGGGHHAVISRILDHLDDAGHPDLTGAGHRVAHGGARFTASVLVDDKVITAIRSFAELAPLHNPANLAGIEAVGAVRPGLPQVAVFDTAFHQAMPASAFRYAVPEEWYRRYGVRRYGFHGTSHRYVSERAAVLLGRPLSGLRLVTAHLGNGCSAAAIRGGVSVDTTMGMTPLEGLVMGTRSGDVDPGLLGYLTGQTGQTAAELTEVLGTRSGLLGLSGVSNDMRAVQAAAAGGDERARLALDVFVHRLARSIAGLIPSLGRLDALVFTGGIGENSALIRGLVLARLGFLGLAEDPVANAVHGRSAGGRISRPGPVQALVVPTDEELMIARDTARLVAARSAVPSLEVTLRPVACWSCPPPRTSAWPGPALACSVHLTARASTWPTSSRWPSPGPTAAQTARPRWYRPSPRCARRNRSAPPSSSGSWARASSTSSWRRSSRPGRRSTTPPMSSWSRDSAWNRPSCTPRASTRRWPARWTPTSCWPAAGPGSRMMSRTWPSS